MALPNTTQSLVTEALAQFHNNLQFDFHPQQRIEIYRSLGPSWAPTRTVNYQVLQGTNRPQLLLGDLARAEIALVTAKKVLPLWTMACEETDSNFGESLPQDEVEQQRYLARRQMQPIESISVYEVPKRFVPSHILEMTELVLGGQVHDWEVCRVQANEWWQIYPRPEKFEREYLIKWAAQEALYAALCWQEPFEEHYTEFERYAQGLEPRRASLLANWEIISPCGQAALAYAGQFDDGTTQIDEQKWREFWLWWLKEAIPQAWDKASQKLGTLASGDR
jgi:hypothetical protein